MRDVTRSRDLFDRFEHRIPVVLTQDGRVLAEGEIRFWPLLIRALSARWRLARKR